MKLYFPSECCWLNINAASFVCLAQLFYEFAQISSNNLFVGQQKNFSSKSLQEKH